ncbi:MAG: HEAT repeat domain-containing protein [Bacteroidetes bacterium]|nr:HEAT repeat domain-containing protein [Bacteroidota bacterium]MCL5035389.1 HEAT repeat domain-containing protein [Bacteroidota bacterium]
MHRKSFSLFLVLVFAAAISFARPAQQGKLPPAHHAPNREFHMLNVSLSFKFNMAKKELFGTAIEKIVPLREHYDTLHLDAVNMKIDKVLMDNKELGYRYNGETLSIGLGRDYGLKDTLAYTIIYSTFPKKGIFFVEPDSAYPNRTPQIWSQSEMEDARYWFPCHDYPDDFMTSSVTATVPENWVVVSNGVLEKVTTDKEDKTKTFHWVEGKTHVIYLISIVAGEFSVIHDHYGDIPIYYYVAPEYARYARLDFSHTPDILRFYSDVTHYPYPWQKLALSAVSDFTFGGMENVSAITLTDQTMHGIDAEPQVSTTDLVSHETAHQWFGDLLTCRSWANAWLNEGFATYFEALYGEHAFGEDHFNYEMYRDHEEVLAADRMERRPTVYNRYYSTVDLFGPFIYQRGASILHMLRGIVGKQLFFKAIQHYVHEFQHQNVDSHDFENAVQEATGYDLGWFFNEWLYKGGHPVFDVNYNYDSGSHLLTMNVRQTQQVDSLTPVYKMPVDIYIVTPSQKITKKVWVDSLSNTYTFEVSSRPLMVNFDQGDYLLKELDFKKPVGELAYQLNHDPDVAGRVWAAQQLAHEKGMEATAALISGLKANSFWGVRMECVQALSGFTGESVETALRAATMDRDPRVQAEAIRGLANCKGKGLGKLLEKIYKTRSNYFVRAAAVSSLAKVEGRKAESVVENALKQDSYNQVIRSAGLTSLAEIDSAKAYKIAVKLSQYGEPHALRLRAISEMVRLGPKNEETIDLLKKYAGDPYIWARMVALNSLGTVGDQSVIPLLQQREKIENDGRLKGAARRAIERIEKRDNSK